MELKNRAKSEDSGPQFNLKTAAIEVGIAVIMGIIAGIYLLTTILGAK